MFTVAIIVLCIVVGFSARRIVKALERRAAPSDPTDHLGARMSVLEDRLVALEEDKKGHDEITHALSHDSRILLEAVKRIDPKAIKTMDEIRSYDNAAEERCERHKKGERHWSDFEPSIPRLEGAVLRLEQEVHALRESRS